jgi:glycogen debranching enzyme
MTEPHHRILVHDGTFAAVGPSGDITGTRGAAPDGLFASDARHLSRWQLTVDGTSPIVLVPTTDGSTDGAGDPTGAAAGASTASVLIPPGGQSEPPPHTVFREQTVTAAGLTEQLRLTSNHPEPYTALLAITVDADFADQFELRPDHRWYTKPHAVRTRDVLPDGVEFGYHRQEWSSRTVITADPAPDAVEETGSGARQLLWQLPLEPHGTTELRLRVTACPHGAPEPAEGGDDFRTAAPRPEEATDWPQLARACRQGMTDLAALRVTAAGPDGELLRVPAAGVPWFVTMLGRHALFTSLFALPYRPDSAAATLLALAASQATAEDPARVAQPGKIVHELRKGELAHFGQVPYGGYYGSVDSTPLFLVLLGAHAEQTGDDKLARRLERQARAAVSWLLSSGGLEEHGYLVYRPDEGGLANQSWKDSPDAICGADGTPAKGLIAAAAPQGYAYDALCRTAALARTVWADPAYAERLEQAAEELRARFLRDFWMPAADFPALALLLDAGGRRADALASDAGHLLWSGILGPEQGAAVGRRLLQPDFFSGWGLRTLAEGQDAYHPLSYHRGSVWPHDSGVAALGLARYGLHQEARSLAEGLVALATAEQGHRLPEVIAGYARSAHPLPVPHPHACTPQSWAAATPLALLTATAAGA